MDKYESPTVEQVGGPNSHIEPNIYAHAVTLTIQIMPMVDFNYQRMIVVATYISES